ncbi:RDD family protein [Sulfurovum sp. ST-21]|uniref:RDD family protein n=1 Tax=Sulfurovum indicum TaxID=2779528 RepID=A0A7M1S603_9BACT|nr:RDD family protein [Sulfurovum indicum]QOR62391.1 RDD family protein [Sulfurovum indicum]
MNETSLQVASNVKRIWSFMIDDMVINLLLMIIFSSQLSALMSGITEVNEASVMMINQFIMDNIVIVLAIKVLYHTILVWQSGMTVGKYLLKIRVVEMNSGMRPSFTQAFWRASVRLISEMFFYIGFVFAFFSPLHQTLHDKLSNCVVTNA